MRITTLAIIALVVSPVLANAGSTSAIVVIATGEAPRVAATLRQQADFLAAPVSLRSDKSDPAERFAAVGTAKSSLMTALAKQKDWVVQEGALSLSGHSGSKFGSSYTPASRADITILVPLGEATDIFATASTITKFVAQQSASLRIEATVGNIELAVREPQKYRGELLKLIASDAVRTRDGIAAGAQIRIEGLESPVRVRQVNAHEVELFIDYRLSIEKR